nr:ABC transporter permease [Pelodictyon luteolum]
MHTLNHKLLFGLRRGLTQMAAVAAVVACGIAVFVSMRSVKYSLEATLEAYYARYRFADVFMQLKRAPGYMEGAVSAVPGVRFVTSRVVADVTLDVPGLPEPATARLISIPERSGEASLNAIAVVAGRYIEPRSLNEVVASRPFMEANGLKPGDRIRVVINGRLKELRIVGTGLSPEYVYEVQPGAFFPDSRHFGVLWMGRTAMESALDMSGAFNDLSVALERDASKEDVKMELDRLLGRYGSLGAYGRDEQISDRFISDEIRQVAVQVTFLPAVFLLAAVFLLNIILSRMVNLQREEIGVLKAMGYRGREIGLHYLGFALLPAAAGVLGGAVGGVFLGRGLMRIYSEYYNFPDPLYLFRPADLLLAVVLSFAAALLGAASSVRRVTALPPAEAMRPESPALYREGLLDRLRFFGRMPVPVKIIVRNLERHPWKSTLSLAMVALAVAILFAGRYAYDATKWMVHVEFGEKHREDVTLLFNNPMPPSIASSLKSGEGVLQDEYYREEPARLSFRHRSKRQSIRGLPFRGGLQRLVDSRGLSRTVPPDGMLLTTELASALGVEAGDTLRVDLLHGRQRSGNVLVAGTIDEILGLSAYMQLEGLNRLAGDDGVVNGALLKIDPAEMEARYADFKQMPGVGGIMLLKALRKSFDELIERSMMTSTIILTVFACVLAFAVVYNGARISLSERSRELAGLRILGMTKGEISFILLGEQAVITLGALIPGYLLGILLSILLARSLNSDLYRMPLVFTVWNVLFAYLVVISVSMLSGFAIWRRLQRLDLVAVLKTRE